MTTRTLLIAALLTGTLSTGAVAQTSDGDNGSRMYLARLTPRNVARIDKAKLNYLHCLMSPNDGVVESGLANCARIKMSAPWEDLSLLKQAIDALAVSGRTISIRYRAYLVTLVFDSPTLFTQEALQDFQSSEDLFNALSKRLQETLLGYSDRKYVRPE